MQTILNFKIESTNEKLTPRTGVAIFGEYLKGLGLEKTVNETIPTPNHYKAYNLFDYVYPLILMLHSGGRVIDDIKEIRLDEALKTILKIDNIPTADAVLKYLHRLGNDGEEAMRKINRKTLKSFLKKLKKDEELILDIDATFIEAHKNTAKYSYKGEPGYMPMIGHVNGGYVIDVDFREGNQSPASRNLEFIKQCTMQLPIGKKFSRVRIDSAGYQADIFNYCNEEKIDIKFTISAPLDTSIQKVIDEVDDEQWKQLGDSKIEKVADTIHTMTDTKAAFRLLIVKKDITPMLPTLEDTLTDEEKAKYYQEMHYCIATNDNDLTPLEIIKLHRQRGETSENKIKELKNGFNMSYLPTSNFEANSFYFAIGTLAYNLFLLFKQILDLNFQKHTVKTIRYKLYNIAGKVVYHARQTTLKVNCQFVELLGNIRKRAYDVSIE
jgi:rRNA-processing protein FCF1